VVLSLFLFSFAGLLSSSNSPFIGVFFLSERIYKYMCVCVRLISKDSFLNEFLSEFIFESKKESFFS
jgi:hypothetical protein